MFDKEFANFDWPAICFKKTRCPLRVFFIWELKEGVKSNNG
jgi:hypothetical protein